MRTRGLVLTLVLVVVGVVLAPASAQAVTAIGLQGVQPQMDSSGAGTAEAFRATAIATGQVTTLQVYVDSLSQATRITGGIYADNGGHPGALLAQGTKTGPAATAWNAIDLGAGAALTTGTTYWISILSPTGAGTVRFRDAPTSTVQSEVSSSSALSALPSSWTSGAGYRDGNVSAYGTTGAAVAPVLSVTPSSLTFAATTGGASPAAKTLAVSNTGGGTLSYTTSSSQPWLSVTPVSGSAPSSLSVTAATGSLTAGTYTGSVTVTSPGVSGSPAVIGVTFTVTDPAPPPPPVLSVTPSSLTFAATTGGASPAAKTLAVSNTGGGTLSYTTSSSQPWLSVTPVSGSAPSSLSVTAATGSLTAGTYTGSVTVTSPGVSGSPAVIGVTFTVTDPAPPPPPTAGDWLQIEHDSARTGDASDETSLTSANASGLSLAWNADVDGKITAQPLFVGGITIAGQSKDVVITSTNANSVYAIDAATGAQIWRRNFGSVAGNCAIPGGFGIGASGAIDRTRGRLYVVTDGGELRTLALTDGTDAATTLPLITGPTTNKVWGGLTLNGTSLYVSTASDGCDTAPWRGVVHRVDVSGTAPSLVKTWTVIPGISAPNGGGGIWGYGGVSADPATGRVYAATAADSNELYQLYGDRLVALDAGLNVLGSWEPSHPAPGSYPCNGDPCDVDFGATPVVFTPSGCPTMVAAGNKDGNLYVSSAATLAAGGAPEQTIRLNPVNDYLGAGGVGGTPAYWAAGRKLFVGDSGPGFGTTAAGVVALSIDAQCRASVTWSRAVGAGGSPNSTPTVAGGVVYIGEGGSGTFRAFDAQTGTPLWTSPAVGAAAYASPIVARGSLYTGTWAGFTFSSAGRLSAFRVGASPPPPPPPGQVLLGDQTVEPQADHTPAGQAEAFQSTASASGTLSKLRVYVDAASNAPKLVVGVYSDTGTHPGTLIAQGSLTSPAAGAWNDVTFTGGAVTAGTRYWIAVLGTSTGTLRFRDRSGGCKSENSSQTTLTALPATWSPGPVYSDCPLSAFGSS